MDRIGWDRTYNVQRASKPNHQTKIISKATNNYQSQRADRGRSLHNGLASGRNTAPLALIFALVCAVAAILFSTARITKAEGAGTAGTQLYSPAENSSSEGVIESTQAITNLQVTLGQPETLLGPTWKLDTQFNTVGRVPSVVGYVSNTNAWAYLTTDLRNLTLVPGMALTIGSSGNFDGCGVWLNSTYKDGNIVRGWYHAETHPGACDASPAHKSVGYAESYDGGLTFVKPSYPNNKVISAPSQYTDPEQASEGDSHVIKVGNYFYMYFVTPRDNYKIHLARSLVTDGGKPGTWWKYYNGTFSQPGIGGESSALASGSVLGRAWVSYNTVVGEYMGFSWSSSGFGLSLSPDGINWRRVTGDVLSTQHEFHNRGPNSGELIDYMSLIGLDGDPALTGSDTWLYYMRVPAGQPMVGDTRYLVRRLIHFETGAPSPTSTLTATSTATSLPTNTPTPSVTPTSTPSDPPTATSSPSYTPTAVPTDTEVPTNTPTSTPTNTPTSTLTSTSTDTATPTMTHTATPTNTPRATATSTPPATSTATVAASSTRTSTSTPTRTATRTRTPVATTKTFPVQIDARVEFANPNTNYGTTYLRTNGGAEPQVESYMRFAVSGISGNIQSAKLRVYSYNGTTNGPAAYSTSGSWTETGITWNNKPIRGGTAYDDKGSIGVDTWVEFNVTPMLSGNGTYNFVLAQNSVDGFYFYSREGTYTPQLVVTYSTP